MRADSVRRRMDARPAVFMYCGDSFLSALGVREAVPALRAAYQRLRLTGDRWDRVVARRTGRAEGPSL
ncbi:hypothetical protein L083_2695 [Actinoplanes sp. N902-109]|nr:hypothetical protein L083_2695 [Actinoplanes sp. N902-109]